MSTGDKWAMVTSGQWCDVGSNSLSNSATHGKLVVVMCMGGEGMVEFMSLEGRPGNGAVDPGSGGWISVAVNY